MAFKCSTQQQATNISQKKMAAAKSSAEALHGAGCLGADTLLQLLPALLQLQLAGLCT